jgi:hypothetical protein
MRLLACLCLPFMPTLACAQPLPEKIEFNRDVRPILADNCYQCHGPDQNQRKADLRLDTKEGLFGGEETRPVVPGKPEESELLRRVLAEKPAQKMPPPKSGKKLTPRQISILQKWVEQGAKWQGHWAYEPLRRPVLPPNQYALMYRRESNPLDSFILAKLAEVNLRPSPEADGATLLRRLSFDLTGLPPTPEEVAAFVNDRDPQAYEKQVERLLASPHYGERMAVFWLDLVRYADSIGYHSDNPMSIWPYRDYVIQAFNTNLPFDRFTLEQLAGDLLPNATRLQKVASGYNRLLMTTEEGGAQPKEYLAKYDADRVRNVSAVWLGSTLGCCQCHDHKYDPFTTKDFYSLAAFFADVQEAAVGRREPGMLLATPDQEATLRKLDERSTALKKQADALRKPWDYLFTGWGLLKERERLQQQRQTLVATIPTTLITRAGPPRTIRVLPRGNWLDDSGPVVQPETPLTLGKLPVQGRRGNRLDLARWLVTPENPLTARVFVNRLWRLYFGQGLAKPLEDFGSQGEWPTHPELLDWLAAEFRESGWDVKHMVRLIVTSQTYRQTSTVRPELRERDPENKYLARQGRFRLEAEFVRDNALAISGLLVRKIGGPSVKPYQPPGYWAALNFPPREWQNDRGEALYRRGLYTHWQRTFLHPSMVAFDATTREECMAERARSNIPQQALVLLNDPTYVEAARVFAARILQEGGATPNERLAWAYRQALSRLPTESEAKLLFALLAKQQQEYQQDKTAAQKLLSVGASPLPKNIDKAELAAWTALARVLLNLHETITRG